MTQDSHLLLKRKLLYRSCNRGCKENDLLLGGFVANNINNLATHELKSLCNLLDKEDNDIFAWITEQKPIPDTLQNSLMTKVINHNKMKKIV